MPERIFNLFLEISDGMNYGMGHPTTKEKEPMNLNSLFYGCTHRGPSSRTRLLVRPIRPPVVNWFSSLGRLEVLCARVVGATNLPAVRGRSRYVRVFCPPARDEHPYPVWGIERNHPFVSKKATPMVSLPLIALRASRQFH